MQEWAYKPQPLAPSVLRMFLRFLQDHRNGHQRALATGLRSYWPKLTCVAQDAKLKGLLAKQHGEQLSLYRELMRHRGCLMKRGAACTAVAV